MKTGKFIGWMVLVLVIGIAVMVPEAFRMLWVRLAGTDAQKAKLAEIKTKIATDLAMAPKK